jgi:SOS response regulatory protein OraA/RecX
MLTTEWNWDTALKVSKEEGLETGRKMGREEDQKEILALIEQGYSAEQIKEFLVGSKE